MITLHEPRGTAAGESRAQAGRLAEPLAPTGQGGNDLEGGRLEVVAARPVASRSSPNRAPRRLS